MDLTIIYIMLAFGLALSAAAVGLAVLLVKKTKTSKDGGSGTQTETEKAIIESLNGIKAETESESREIRNCIKMENAMLTGGINAQNQSTRDITARFDTFMNATSEKLESMKADNAKNIAEVKESNVKALSEVRAENAKSINELRQDNTQQLDKMRLDNTAQLDKMRQTVDEKLSSTLEQRFNQSFKIVSDRLEAINHSFADLQNLQTGVNDLKSIFKNVKTRGTWGEVALENLLSQILTEGQFEKQYNLSRTGSELVDFVIKLPGKGEGEVMLPIDAKFPIEDYQRLVEASEKGDADGVDAAGRAIEKRIKGEAQSIRDKYIKPPKTTDFAIMYLPVEGLFAEVIKRHGLMEDLQNRCRVVICGPTTLAALLNSLQMGFRSVAIEKRSTEIGKLLNAFVKDFDQFSTLLVKTSKSLDTAQSQISMASKRTEIIRGKLNKVGRFADIEEKEQVLLGKGEPFADETEQNLLDKDELFTDENEEDGALDAERLTN